MRQSVRDIRTNGLKRAFYKDENMRRSRDRSGTKHKEAYFIRIKTLRRDRGMKKKIDKNKKTTMVILIALSAVVCVLAAVLFPLHFATYRIAGAFDEFLLDVVNIEDTNAEIGIVDRTDSYLAHPDLLFVDGKYICMYVSGHGKGEIVTKVSSDGTNWGERIDGTPSSWTNSLETPTLYDLRFVDGEGAPTGEDALIMITGCPKWPDKFIKEDGFQYSISADGGESWSEFTKCYGQQWGRAYDCIVAMSSLTQMKENGKFVNKWMGTFHDHKYVNYKTFLTFETDDNGDLIRDEQGRPVANWSVPERLFNDHRAYEKRYEICEVEVIRTPSEDGLTLSGDTLILLGRANRHLTGSVIMFSDDEGATWSAPRELPHELTGDRHKAEYDPVTKKLVVSFRQVVPAQFTSKIASGRKKTGEGWLGWVGDFDDLLSFRTDSPTLGGKVLMLGREYGGKMDCGYSGTSCVNGTFCLVAYGRFDESASEPYIRYVKFDLRDIL